MSTKLEHIAMGNSIAMVNKLNNVLRRKRKQNPRWRPVKTLEYVAQRKKNWAFEISKCTYAKFYFLALSWHLADMLFNNTGTVLYLLMIDDPYIGDISHIYECPLSIPYDFSTITSARVIYTFDPAAEVMCFNGNGTVLYTNDDWKIEACNLSIPYDISSIYSTYTVTGTLVTVNSAIMFNNTGSVFYSLDAMHDVIYEFNLSTPYDVSTTYGYESAFPGSVILSVADQTTFPVDMCYNSDGTKLFILDGGVNNDIYQYNLSTPYDISTANSPSVAIHIASDIFTMYRTCMIFNGDGSKLYIAALTNDTIMIIEYAIIPHDSIATFNGITWNPATVPTPDLMT